MAGLYLNRYLLRAGLSAAESQEGFKGNHQLSKKNAVESHELRPYLRRSYGGHERICLHNQQASRSPPALRVRHLLAGRKCDVADRAYASTIQTVYLQGDWEVRIAEDRREERLAL